MGLWPHYHILIYLHISFKNLLFAPISFIILYKKFTLVPDFVLVTLYSSFVCLFVCFLESVFKLYKFGVPQNLGVFLMLNCDWARDSNPREFQTQTILSTTVLHNLESFHCSKSFMYKHLAITKGDKCSKLAVSQYWGKFVVVTGQKVILRRNKNRVECRRQVADTSREVWLKTVKTQLTFALLSSGVLGLNLTTY